VCGEESWMWLRSRASRSLSWWTRAPHSLRGSVRHTGACHSFSWPLTWMPVGPSGGACVLQHRVAHSPAPALEKLKEQLLWEFKDKRLGVLSHTTGQQAGQPWWHRLPLYLDPASTFSM
jgi:hypothetical protein